MDVIWLGPIFESSQMDLWMDVTNFTAVDGVFGALQDFEELVATVHNKSMITNLEFTLINYARANEYHVCTKSPNSVSSVRLPHCTKKTPV